MWGSHNSHHISGLWGSSAPSWAKTEKGGTGLGDKCIPVKPSPPSILISTLTKLYTLNMHSFLHVNCIPIKWFKNIKMKTQGRFTERIEDVRGFDDSEPQVPEDQG